MTGRLSSESDIMREGQLIERVKRYSRERGKERDRLGGRGGGWVGYARLKEYQVRKKKDQESESKRKNRLGWRETEK